MLLKLGVDISRLKRPIRRVLSVVEAVYKSHGEEAVITSTYEGDHGVASLHYADLAIDFRYPKRNIDVVIRELRENLGDDYDVVNSSGCIHIEYDPKERG